MKIFIIIVLSCLICYSCSTQSQKREDSQNVNFEQEEKTSDDGFKNDTISNVKIFGEVKINDSIKIYKSFLPAKLESDVGVTNLHVLINDSLRWELILNHETVLFNNKLILLVNLETDCIKYYAIKNGVTVKNLCLSNKFDLNDANEFELTSNKLFIKLVNDSTYTFNDIISIDSSFQVKALNLNFQGYIELKKTDNDVSLYRGDEKLLVLEKF